ncbi:MAG: DNA-directed RNA polymerase subunit beta [Clostridiales bacterium]|nr:DNA-directed RNA polymerase subunit beta [Clostridiales bacterium]
MKALNLKELHNEKALRYTFSKIGDSLEIPNLIKVQIDSYNDFLTRGIGEVFKAASPIVDHQGNLILEFFGYRLEDETKYDLEETKSRSLTYSKRLYANVRLINKETGEIKEQEIFMGDIPIMTDSATFVINGTERVIVSQLIRSPGVYFEPVAQATKTSNLKMYRATIMPATGTWVEFETEPTGSMFSRIDRTRKIPSTVVLRALGLENSEDIVKLFGEEDILIKTLAKDTIETEEEALMEIYKKIRPGELPTIDAARNFFNAIFFDPRRYNLSRVGRFKYDQKLALSRRINKKVLAENIVDPETGEILFEKGHKLEYEEAVQIQNTGINRVVVKFNGKEVVVLGNGTVDIANFIGEELKEKLSINEDVNYLALTDILENTAEEDLESELNKNMGRLIPEHITKEDMLATFSYLLNLTHGMYKVDNIDHLGNRRIRSVGEIVQNEFRKGVERMDRGVRERMTLQDLDTITPQTLINLKPITSMIKKFFHGSQLSQVLDQTNPLSELSHKRRISSLGPGGLSRDRAGFEVRDIHYTHYGRLCPVESPEGANVGLILSLSSFARINDFGFIETPYRKIDKKTGKLTDEIVYMSSDMEDNFVICQAIEPLTKEGTIRNARVRARYLDDIKEVDREEVDYMDISPKQLVSAATAMIPFLENDDGRRALMGANMQKQAVPLIKTDSPMVGTGMEYRTAKDSGVVVKAKKAGKVVKVTGDFIRIEEEGSAKVRQYDLRKMKKTTNSTCINEKAIVREGETVFEGQTIADSMATDKGEMALGKNAVVAFANWEGYNYEDAILISENLVKNDVYTSVHIEEYECESRDTKLGPEEITREVPNVGEEALKDLDENGIIRVGAIVKPGDILVGKITPKGETELTAEERLLRAIFGEKAREVRDTSLRVPHGEGGTILDVKRFTRADSDEMKTGVNEVVRIYIAQKRKIIVGDKMAGRHGNKGVVSRVLPAEDMPYLEDGTPVDIILNPLGVPSRMNLGQVLEVHLGEVARRLGVKFETPVFDGANDLDIEELLKLSGAREDGKTYLYDGRTGERFDNPVTVGIMYMLKLHHLVDDKMHARSIGSYSLVTKQPLGGKAQFGGQRFGEMEVWALQGYGAAYTLQEMLTVKSDDVKQREKTYEAIVKGENLPTPGIPEGFRVLMKELQSLGLNMELLKENDEEIIIKESTEDDEDNIIKTREGLSETPEQGEEDDYSNEVIEQEDEFAGDFEEIFENEGGMEIVDQEDLDM